MDTDDNELSVLRQENQQLQEQIELLKRIISELTADDKEPLPFE